MTVGVFGDGVGEGDLGVGLGGHRATVRRRQCRRGLPGEEEGVALELGELSIDLDAAQVRDKGKVLGRQHHHHHAEEGGQQPPPHGGASSRKPTPRTASIHRWSPSLRRRAAT